MRNSSSISCRLLAHFRFVYCESGTHFFSKHTFFLNLQILWKFISDVHVASPFKRALKKMVCKQNNTVSTSSSLLPVVGFEEIWVYNFFIVFFLLNFAGKISDKFCISPLPPHTHIWECWLWWQHGRLLNACAVPEPTADEMKPRPKNARDRFLLYDHRKTKQEVMSNDTNLPRHHRLSVSNGALYSSVYLY